MKGTLTIAWRDFRALINTPLFYVIAGMCSLVWSVMYWQVLTQFSQASMQMQFRRVPGEGLNLHFQAFTNHISLVNFILILAVPALTMRLLAEEKKVRTYDLLLTSPVTATHITLGKFLAGLGASSVLLILSFVYPLSTAYVADLQWGPLFSSYIGLFLVVAAYVAVGLFASAITSSVMLAVVMGLIFNVGLWFVGAGAEMVDSESWKAFYEHLSLGGHFTSFLKGSVRLTSLAFFLSTIFFYCFLTQRVIESSRWR